MFICSLLLSAFIYQETQECKEHIAFPVMSSIAVYLEEKKLDMADVDNVLRLRAERSSLWSKKFLNQRKSSLSTFFLSLFTAFEWLVQKLVYTCDTILYNSVDFYNAK